ncbi:helix-turn-helix domain-containing protein [Sedimentitalea sp. XS_ASV28]|uniref:AraC family transcriptional regulator n=1 Tax=Sedimentitalea sp. XS_ASV28 TaxID=3241296 RepID=UPI003513A631
MVAGVVPVLAVWAGAEVFLDRPVYRPWHGAMAVLVCAGAWLAPILPFAATLRGILVVLLYVALLYVTLSTAAGDLVETRRRFRRWFVSLMALTGLGISLVELLSLDAALPSVVYPLHASAFLVLTLLFLSWTIRIAPDLWPLRKESDLPPAMPLSAADSAVLQRIEAAMDDGIWRQEGLAIGQLAAAVDAPEHRVRRAINKGLGYRNFAQFVNERRIEAAREVLSDPARADRPVLTIAYDVGFASVGPFNRAFRAIAGQSPTEYRKEHSAVPMP